MNKPKDWKQQFFEVKTIGPEPALNKEGFWKKREVKELKFQDERDHADRNRK